MSRKQRIKNGTTGAKIIAAMALVSLILFILIVTGCSPVITSHQGYVIHIDSEIIAVEYERMDKPGYGIVRYYPFVKGFEIGDCYGCGR